MEGIQKSTGANNLYSSVVILVRVLGEKGFNFQRSFVSFIVFALPCYETIVIEIDYRHQ